MLLIDSREPSCIKSLFPEAQETKLVAGDFLDTTSGLLIERKTVLDLLASIADKRLYIQCESMSNISPFPCLLVHGSLLADRNGLVVANGQHTQWD